MGHRAPGTEATRSLAANVNLKQRGDSCVEPCCNLECGQGYTHQHDPPTKHPLNPSHPSIAHRPVCRRRFLGTSSAVPSQTRNHSSLCLTLPSGSTHLFDAGEATQNQLQRVAGGFKLSALRKIFITHMHGDHVFGLVPLLCTLMNGAGGSVGVEDPRKLAAEAVGAAGEAIGPIRTPDFEIYGPKGLREYVRSSLRLTNCQLASTYVVHELHTPMAIGSPSRKVLDDAKDRAPMELAGFNLFPDEVGCWVDILSVVESPTREWEVSAGSILHSVPCVGYVLTEPPINGKITADYRDKLVANKTALAASGVKNPMSLLSKVSALKEGESIELPDGQKLFRPPDRRGRRITILGDTCDPSSIFKIAEGSDVLVHEATNAFLGDKMGKLNKDYREVETYEDVKKKTIEHGHSTPEMAADMASKISLGRNGGVVGKIAVEEAASKGKGKEADKPRGILLLNHFSSRYADPRSSETAAVVMEEIRQCAVRTLEETSAAKDTSERQPVEVVCAYDLMQYEIRTIKSLSPTPPRNETRLSMQEVFTPSSTSPIPYELTPENISYANYWHTRMSATITPRLDPIVSPAILVHRYIKPTLHEENNVENPDLNPQDPMEAIRASLQSVELGPQAGGSQQVTVKKEDYTIPLDGDHRELARTMMVKMLRMGLGALHPEKTQRKNEMINEIMLYPWDKVVGVVLWNLCRLNPFNRQNSLTKRLDGLWDGFRQMFLDICFHAQGQLDFAEAACRFLYQSQHLMVKMDLKLLHFFAKVYSLTGHGFYLLNYRHFRDSIGEPLGVHLECTFMDRERVPKIQADFVLMMMNNEAFDASDVQLPMEIIEAAGLVIRTLHQFEDKENVHDVNNKIFNHIARNIFSGGRKKIANWCKMSASSVAFNDLDLLVTAAERIFEMDYFPALDSTTALQMRAMVVKKSPMGLWDAALGDNLIRFRLQFFYAMRERERLPDVSKKSLKAYLSKLDPKKTLMGCHEVVPVEEAEDPYNLPRKVGEHPEVVIRLLVLHAYFRHGDHQGGKRVVDPADATILNLLWWVLVKEAYQRTSTQPLFLESTTKLFLKYEDWLLPLVREHWDADPRRAADILMYWFINGIQKHGIIARHADQQNHPLLHQIFDCQFGVEFPIELLNYHHGEDLVPIFEPMKDRVIVSAFSILYYLVKGSQVFHDVDIIHIVLKTMSNAFATPDYYLQPENRRPRGYYGMYKMGMEILTATSQAVFEKAIMRVRNDLHILPIQETLSFLVKKSTLEGDAMLKTPLDAVDREAITTANIRKFNDSAMCLRNLLEFIIICAPRENVLRMRLRRRAIVAPLCFLINYFTEKPDIAGLPRGAPRPVAIFARVPAMSRAALGNFLQTGSRFLNMLLKDWAAEETVSQDMLDQRESILNLAMEADVAGDMVIKMDRAGRPTFAP
ncbi:LOW QUALITY PROTEIN: Zinc phosphodiesterase [Drechslerella dactyloides]|uniref:Zinc phosphodiesterase n=1 Tax=Drechslerella dactyloides TaxID=74499 RepID=A0AAD6IXS0_DREDA|nr:LOW QUALITY PROTEIN: Zinc phosphodiesterase [Drechslerella dactyloides]